MCWSLEITLVSINLFLFEIVPEAILYTVSNRVRGPQSIKNCFGLFSLGLLNSYTMTCPPVSGDNPRALASGLSYVQVVKHGIPILYHPLHVTRCIVKSWQGWYKCYYTLSLSC